MPDPEKKIKHFVRREKTMRAFDEFLRSDESVWVADLSGAHGIGKTTVLLHYYRSRGNIQHAWIDLRARKYKAIPCQDETTPAAVAALFDAQQGYRTLLLDIAADLFGADSPAFLEILADIKQVMPDNLAQAGKFLSQIGRFVRKVNFKPEFSFAGMRLGLGGLEFEAPFDSKKSFSEQADIRRRMTDALARRVVAMNLRGNTLIVFDDFCHIRGSYLEKWIATELLPRLRGCKIVLSHTEMDSAFLPADAFSVPLERFSLAETRKYVEIRLGSAALPSEMVERLHTQFDGNPQQIEWALDSIQMVGAEHAGELAFFRQPASSVSGGGMDDLAAMQIDLVVRRSPEMKTAIDVACLLQEFDRKLFEEVLAGAIPDVELSLSSVWKKLGELSFIESKGDGRIYVVHPQIARWRETFLRERNATFVEDVHRLAAAWYGTAMQKREEDADESVWERLHQYELPEWQTLSQGWLRHLAANPDAGLEVATRYFDAYFWWGEYVEFPFCERLIEDLKAASLSPRSRKIVEMLDEFHRSFIPQRQQSGAADWTQDVLLVLSHLSDRLGLNAPSPDDARRWHLRGLVENYVAEARYAANHRDPLAEVAYRNSAEAFFKARQICLDRVRQSLEDGDRKTARRCREQANTEAWYGGWMCVWLAGLYAEWSQPDKAVQAAELAEQTILKVDPKDIEALGRIHAARGDVHFAAHRWDEALREYQLYALFALGFLIDEYGVGGDIYTFEYLRESIEHIYARLVSLQAADAAVLSSWWAAWIAFWGEDASSILPDGLAASFSGGVERLMRTDPLGHVVEHSLPLPRLPEYEITENLGLGFRPEFQKAVERVFYSRRDQCIRAGLLPRMI